jgi:prepilin peptidase CpaA
VVEALRTFGPGGLFFILENAMPIEQYREVALLLLVSIAAVNDLATRRIPNRLLLAGLGSALALHLLSPTPGAFLLAALGGMGVGLVVFLPFYVLRGMAAGDVKMMVVIGAFTGPEEVFKIAVLTWCIGGLIALVLVTFSGRLRLALGNLGRMMSGAITPGSGPVAPDGQQSAGSMPYGVAIALGTFSVLVSHYG